MTRNDQLFEKIRKFVVANYWDLKKGLHRETRVLEDLGIDGDDAVELLEKFGKEFSVDFSEFVIEKYFNLEGFDPIGLSILIRKLRGEKIPQKSSHALTLGDLEQAVLVGKWVTFSPKTSPK